MPDQPKPIKRSMQLAPLSRDHHEGLLFVWKIRQGMQNGTDPKLIAAFVQWFWESHLRDHFQDEEQVLAPHLPAENEALKKMLDDHQEIEALFHINESIADTSLLAQLASVVHDHIRFEERTLFPLAEKFITPEKLDGIHSALTHERKTCANWEQEFWLKK